METTTNIAHRGARSIAPENTIAAAGKALVSGADLWETDVAVSKDGELFLFHDDSLVRTTDAKEKFPGRRPWVYTDFLWREIQTLDAGSVFVDRDPFGQIKEGAVSTEDLQSYRGEKIPSLEQALLFTEENDFKINLEIKYLSRSFQDFPIAAEVIKLINRLKIDPLSIIISSFNHYWLKQVETMMPEIEVQALIGYSKMGPLNWGKFEFPVYNARSTLIDSKQITTAKEKGKKINLFTINKVEDMKRFIDAGIDGLITDFPQRLASINKRNSKKSP
ncbi:MAG: glycerophosphodiester phosphodiesterase family protein [Desulfatiglandaceae bacterium]